MKKYLLIIVTFLISSIFHIFFRNVGFDIAMGAILFQLLGSMVLGFVISMFVAKYKKNSWMRYWKIMYVLMVSVNLLVFILDFMTPA